MSPNRSRTAIAGFALALTLSACGSDAGTLDATAADTTAATTTTQVEVAVRTAEEGEAARARLAAFRPAGPASLSVASENADVDLASSDMAIEGEISILPIDPCGDLTIYEPTPEDIAAANSNADGLAAALDAAGVAYTSTTDDFGFVNIEYDWEDPAAQAAADAYWFERYPPEPIDPVELERNGQENDAIAAKLDAAGVLYTRTTGLDGWETLDLDDWDDPAAQAAIDAAYNELYPVDPAVSEAVDPVPLPEDGVIHTDELDISCE